MPTELHKRQDHYEVVAVWTSPSQPGRGEGPSEVVIRLQDDVPQDVRRRGITSGVIRRLEPVVLAMTRMGQEEGGATSSAKLFEAAVASSIADLGPSPRADDNYYAGLLRVFELVAATEPDPVNFISRISGVPKETIRTRLRTARRLMREGKVQPASRRPQKEA